MVLFYVVFLNQLLYIAAHRCTCYETSKAHFCKEGTE